MEDSSVHEDLPKGQKVREDSLRSMCLVVLMNALIPASHPLLLLLFKELYF